MKCCYLNYNDFSDLISVIAIGQDAVGTDTCNKAVVSGSAGIKQEYKELKYSNMP